MQVEEHIVTKPIVYGGVAARWRATTSPTKRYVAKKPLAANGNRTKQRKQNGEEDIYGQTDSPHSSKSPKARGIPSWEHPKRAIEVNIPKLNLHELSTTKPNKHPNQNESPSSPVGRSSPPRNRVSPTKKPKESHSVHPNFVNMIISFKREDSLMSLGEITFDESIEYDINYQNHLRRLKREKRIYQETNGRGRPLDVSATQCKTSPLREASGDTKLPKRKGTLEMRSPMQESSQSLDNRITSQHHALGSPDINFCEPMVSRPETSKRRTKEKSKPIEIEPVEGSEVSVECVSLSDLFNNWREQSGSVVTLNSSPVTATSRSTMPTPLVSTGLVIRIESQDGTNNTGSSLTMTQDDAEYIFGRDTVAALDREQEELMMNMALQRSLEDFSSHTSGSSVSGFSSQASSALESGIYSIETGHRAVRANFGVHRNTVANQQQISAFTGAGCHLAIAASSRKTGNMKIPATLARASMLQVLADDSDEEDDVPYSAPASGQASFAWKRDTRTNKWYKKPVLYGTAQSDEEKMLEQVMQQSAREAMKESFVELQRTAAAQRACRHW